MSITPEKFDIVVVGTGPAGLVAALALATTGARIALVGPLPDADQRAADTRTAALFAPSIALLENLGLWSGLAAGSAPIRGIRLIDDTGALLKAPETLFTAREVDLKVFGYNIPNALLVEALLDTLSGRVEIIDERAAAIEPGTAGVAITTASGRRIAASAVIAADGRQSLAREAAGIGVERWAYPQSAIATSFTHPAPHDGVSSELHRPMGPLTTVPMPGLRSSLVWVESPREAARLHALGSDAFAGELDRRLMGLLGRPRDIGRRALFPLEGLTAQRLAARRVLLVGEAAHVIPPIGAQGLNLGLRDIGHLVDILGDALRLGRDLGADDVLATYERARRGDVGSRTMAVDVLNRSLISGWLPIGLGRGLALQVLNMTLALRRSLIREGLGLAATLPRLMRSVAAIAPGTPFSGQL